MLLVALFSLSIVGGQAERAPQPLPPPPPAQPVQPNEDRMICKRERVLGSNRPQRICMSQREREHLAIASRDAVERAQREAPTLLPKLD